MSLTGVNDNLSIDVIIPIQTFDNDDEIMDRRAFAFGGLNSDR